MNEKIEKIRKLIESRDPNQESNEKKLAEQDVFLFLGLSGTGKSTLVNYLAGCCMVRTIDAYTGSTVIDALDPIAGIGHTAQSETVRPLTVFLKKPELTLCDCPGFHDNRGLEYNVAGALLLQETIQKARSVKGYAVLIDYASIQNSRKLRLIETARYLTELLPGLERIRKSILFFITKIPDKCDKQGFLMEMEGIAREVKQKLQEAIARDKYEEEVKQFLSTDAWEDGLQKLDPNRTLELLFCLKEKKQDDNNVYVTFYLLIYLKCLMNEDTVIMANPLDPTAQREILRIMGNCVPLTNLPEGRLGLSDESKKEIQDMLNLCKEDINRACVVLCDQIGMTYKEEIADADTPDRIKILTQNLDDLLNAIGYGNEKSGKKIAPNDFLAFLELLNYRLSDKKMQVKQAVELLIQLCRYSSAEATLSPGIFNMMLEELSALKLRLAEKETENSEQQLIQFLYRETGREILGSEKIHNWAKSSETLENLPDLKTPEARRQLLLFGTSLGIDRLRWQLLQSFENIEYPLNDAVWAKEGTVISFVPLPYVLLSQVLDKLRNENRLQNIKRFLLISRNTIEIDTDMKSEEFSGVSVGILCHTLAVFGTHTLDVSSRPGRDGENSADHLPKTSDRRDLDGEDGKPGENGADATPCGNILLSARTLYKKDHAKLTLLAKGASGGNGGKGADGTDGKPGREELNEKVVHTIPPEDLWKPYEIQIIEGQRGEDGGKGGTGGCGGQGGAGSKAGKISLMGCLGDKTETLFEIVHRDGSFGNDGAQGANGKGGAGAKGGRYGIALVNKFSNEAPQFTDEKVYAEDDFNHAEWTMLNQNAFKWGIIELYSRYGEITRAADGSDGTFFSPTIVTREEKNIVAANTFDMNEFLREFCIANEFLCLQTGYELRNMLIYTGIFSSEVFSPDYVFSILMGLIDQENLTEEKAEETPFLTHALELCRKLEQEIYRKHAKNADENWSLAYYGVAQLIGICEERLRGEGKNGNQIVDLNKLNEYIGVLLDENQTMMQEEKRRDIYNEFQNTLENDIQQGHRRFKDIEAKLNLLMQQSDSSMDALIREIDMLKYNEETNITILKKKKAEAARAFTLKMIQICLKAVFSFGSSFFNLASSEMGFKSSQAGLENSINSSERAIRSFEQSRSLLEQQQDVEFTAFENNYFNGLIRFSDDDSPVSIRVKKDSLPGFNENREVFESVFGALRALGDAPNEDLSAIYGASVLFSHMDDPVYNTAFEALRLECSRQTQEADARDEQLNALRTTREVQNAQLDNLKGQKCLTYAANCIKIAETAVSFAFDVQHAVEERNREEQAYDEQIKRSRQRITSLVNLHASMNQWYKTNVSESLSSRLSQRTSKDKDKFDKLIDTAELKIYNNHLKNCIDSIKLELDSASQMIQIFDTFQELIALQQTIFDKIEVMEDQIRMGKLLLDMENSEFSDLTETAKAYLMYARVNHIRYLAQLEGNAFILWSFPFGFQPLALNRAAREEPVDSTYFTKILQQARAQNQSIRDWLAKDQYELKISDGIMMRKDFFKTPYAAVRLSGMDARKLLTGEPITVSLLHEIKEDGVKYISFYSLIPELTSYLEELEDVPELTICTLLSGDACFRMHDSRNREVLYRFKQDPVLISHGSLKISEKNHEWRVDTLSRSLIKMEKNKMDSGRSPYCEATVQLIDHSFKKILRVDRQMVRTYQTLANLPYTQAQKELNDTLEFLTDCQWVQLLETDTYEILLPYSAIEQSIALDLLCLPATVQRWWKDLFYEKSRLVAKDLEELTIRFIGQGLYVNSHLYRKHFSLPEEYERFRMM